MSLFLAALILASDPSAAAPPPVQPATVEKPKKAKKICKREDVDTGSHMAKRTCLTEDQWNARKAGISADEYQALHGRVGH